MEGRCKPLSPEGLLRLVEERAPEGLRERFASSLRRLLGELSRARGEGVELEYVVVFGSTVDPTRRLRRDSDIDVIVVARRGDVLGVLSERAPLVVRLKRLPDGSIDAHTQLLDVENGVAWHVIQASPRDAEEKLEAVKGPCYTIKVSR